MKVITFKQKVNNQYINKEIKVNEFSLWHTFQSLSMNNNVKQIVIKDLT